jgi:copper resistance protein C
MNRSTIRARTPDMSVRISRLLAVAAVALALLGTGTGVASAHDELLRSNPGAGAMLDAAPATVELQFSGDVQELGTEVVVTAADGSTVSDGAVQVDGATVTQPLPADLPGGEYSVDWRVTSADGHPEADSFSFTVAGGDAGPVAGGEASATTETGSTSTTWIVVGAAVVLAAALVVGLRGLRRRS